MTPNVGALAYDAIAADYDQQVEGDAWMRRVLHAHYARAFGPGDRVLDVGCGTGLDSIALAQRGVDVLAVDFSPAMIARLREKVVRSELAGRVEARVLDIRDLGLLLSQAEFDGLVSAFAGLSTLDDLSQFAGDAARLVRPGGHMVLHLLNRFSLWEWLGYISRRNLGAARQVGRLRAREFTIGGRRVRHALYFPREAYARFFRTYFAPRGVYSLGAIRPPHTVQRLPSGVTNTLEWLDVRLGRWPLIDSAGRFWVMDLQRLPAA